MHILKVIHGYPPFYNAGSEVYSQSICNELSKRNKVTIFSREEDPFRPDLLIRWVSRTPSYSHVLVNMARGKDGYRHAELDKLFGELLDSCVPDVAHIGHLNHLSTGIIDELVRRKIPILFTLHDFWLMCPRGQFLQRNFGGDYVYRLCNKQEDRTCAVSCYSMLFGDTGDVQYWESWIAKRMSATHNVVDQVNLFIAPSQYLKNRFTSDFGIPEDKIVYLDYGFPSEYLSPLTPKSSGPFTFGYIGTHIPAKGIQDLIKAFSRLSGDCKLRIWGRPRGQETTALRKLAFECGVESRVEWMGEYINHNIAQDVFSKCDCVVVPSIWAENSPLVIHEAQACRIPVITADFGGMKEYVAHKVNGLLYRHRDSESLREWMQWALEHPQQMHEYGQRGYLHTNDGRIPDISTHCLTLESIYQNLIHSYGK